MHKVYWTWYVVHEILLNMSLCLFWLWWNWLPIWNEWKRYLFFRGINIIFWCLDFWLSEPYSDRGIWGPFLMLIKIVCIWFPFEMIYFIDTSSVEYEDSGEVTVYLILMLIICYYLWKAMLLFWTTWLINIDDKLYQLYTRLFLICEI